jgi:hypothetical protein
MNKIIFFIIVFLAIIYILEIKNTYNEYFRISTRTIKKLGYKCIQNIPYRVFNGQIYCLGNHGSRINPATGKPIPSDDCLKFPSDLNNKTCSEIINGANYYDITSGPGDTIDYYCEIRNPNPNCKLLRNYIR